MNGGDGTGQPVEELRLLEQRPRRGFLGRIHRSIQRREFAGALIDASWSAWSTALLEYLRFLLELVFGSEDTKRGESGTDMEGEGGGE